MLLHSQSACCLSVFIFPLIWSPLTLLSNYYYYFSSFVLIWLWLYCWFWCIFIKEKCSFLRFSIMIYRKDFFIHFEYHAVVNSYSRGSVGKGYSNATEKEPSSAESTISGLCSPWFHFSGVSSSYSFYNLQSQALVHGNSSNSKVRDENHAPFSCI